MESVLRIYSYAMAKNGDAIHRVTESEVKP